MANVMLAKDVARILEKVIGLYKKHGYSEAKNTVKSSDWPQWYKDKALKILENLLNEDILEHQARSNSL